MRAAGMMSENDVGLTDLDRPQYVRGEGNIITTDRPSGADLFGSSDAGAPLNEKASRATNDKETESGNKPKRHRRGTRGGQKARVARGTAAKSTASEAEAPAPARAKTTRTRKPRASKKASAAEIQNTKPQGSARKEPPSAPKQDVPKQEVLPVIAEPPAAAPQALPEVPAQESRRVQPQAESSPADNAVTENSQAPQSVRPLGGYRAPMNRSSGRMSFGGRSGGRQHFRPSGFSRPAVPPAPQDGANTQSQPPAAQPVDEQTSAPQQAPLDSPAQNSPIAPQQGDSQAPVIGGVNANAQDDTPEPGNELHLPAGRDPQQMGRQAPGFRGPNRVEHNQGRGGKFPQQRGSNRGQQGNSNQQNNNRGNNQPRQNWQGQQPRGNQPQSRHQNGSHQQGNNRNFNQRNQQGHRGQQPRFDRGPRQPHQSQQFAGQQNAPQTFTQPVPQPQIADEIPSYGAEIEADTRPLSPPAVPSPVINEGVVAPAATPPESAEHAAPVHNGDNGDDNGALAPFAEDIEIDETPIVSEKRREPTGRDMIINVVEGEEVRIAIIKKGVLEEFYMERASNESHVGNIYKGRVTNVEPSIQAAFVDFGLGKNGFLHISDVHPMYFGPQYRAKFQRVMEKREAERKRQQQQRTDAAQTAAQAAQNPSSGEQQTENSEVPSVVNGVDSPAFSENQPNDAAALNTAPAVSDIDAELNAEAPPEVLFDSDSEKKQAEESAPHAESAGTAPAAEEIPTHNPESPSVSDEHVAFAATQADVPASFAAEPQASAESSDAPAPETPEASDQPHADATAETQTPAAEADAQAAAPATPAAEAAADEDDDDLGEFELDDGGIAPMERVGKKTPRRDRPPIQQCLRRGQEVIVQVTKEGIGTKGPTLTTYVSIPGRALVMMPGMSALGVSRKIEDEQQRRSLRRILSELNPPRNLGFIIRTAGAELTKPELQGDLNYLVRMWKVIAQRLRNNKAPIELYQESDLVIRTMRDGFTNDIDRIIVDNEQVASRIRDFLSIVDPRSAGSVELYTGTLPIFQRYNIERQIENIHSRRVELPNGGSLVIDSAEALVAIDVNSGRYREQRDAEMTAFNMNKEAVKEIVRQLRLRDLGGVIVMDFIDMREERHKREIEHLLREHMKHDRGKNKVLRMSQFCMIEMTRQRVRPSIKRSIYMDCPHCRGTALIKTPESVSLDVMRRLTAGTTRADVQRLDVRLYPTVANYLLNRKRKALVELEEKTGKRINIQGDPMVAGDAVQIDAYNGRDDRINVQL